MRDATRAARTAASIIAAACLALLAVGCGGSPSSAAAGGAAKPAGLASAQLVAFARCMRSRGVSKFPDPTAGGGFAKETPQQLGVSRARLQAGQTACERLLPNGGRGPTPAAVRQMAAQALRFSQCVRHHGVANFPDPNGSGRIPDPSSLGINQGAQLFQAANHACRAYRPPYIPSNAAYASWARARGG